MQDINANKIRVIIADDHALFLDSLHMLLRSDPQIEVAGEAADGKILAGLAKELNPDVVLTDINMPDTDGIEAIKTIQQDHANVRCIILTTFGNDQLIIDALEAGAIGYINKNASN